MASDISPENEQFIQHEIASGAFANRQEALDAGVDMLKQRRQIIERLKESRRQLDEGECVELDGAGLRNLFEQLKQRAQNQATN